MCSFWLSTYLRVRRLGAEGSCCPKMVSSSLSPHPSPIACWSVAHYVYSSIFNNTMIGRYYYYTLIIFRLVGLRPSGWTRHYMLNCLFLQTTTRMLMHLSGRFFENRNPVSNYKPTKTAMCCRANKQQGEEDLMKI